MLCEAAAGAEPGCAGQLVSHEQGELYILPEEAGTILEDFS
jgi:hypothetical protein